MAKRKDDAEDGQAVQSGEHRNVSRTSRILDVLAEAKNNGMRLTDVVNATGLKKTVVHRALEGLVAHDMAFFDEGVSRFYLGDRLFRWVSTARERFVLAERVLPYVASLAADLHDNAYCLIRRGDRALCVGFAEGDFPFKSLTLKTGDMRPLGAGSGPLAILAGLPDDEVEAALASTRAGRAEYGIDDETTRRKVAEAREQRYAIHEGLHFKMMTGVAVPVCAPAGKCVASLSVVAVATRLEPPRLEEVVARIRRECEKMEVELAPLLDELL